MVVGSLTLQISCFKSRLQAADAEIERLRHLLTERCDAVTHWKTQLNEAQAEIARLRAALKEIGAYSSESVTQHLVHCALQPKEGEKK